MSELRTRIIHTIELTLDEHTKVEITVWRNKRGGVYEVTYEFYEEKKRNDEK